MCVIEVGHFIMAHSARSRANSVRTEARAHASRENGAQNGAHDVDGAGYGLHGAESGRQADQAERKDKGGCPKGGKKMFKTNIE